MLTFGHNLIVELITCLVVTRLVKLIQPIMFIVLQTPYHAKNSASKLWKCLFQAQLFGFHVQLTVHADLKASESKSSSSQAPSAWAFQVLALALLNFLVRLPHHGMNARKSV